MDNTPRYADDNYEHYGAAERRRDTELYDPNQGVSIF